MPSLGWQELLLILVIVIIIFGVGKLPEIGGAMGKGIKEFRANATDSTDDNNTDVKADTSKPVKEEL